MRYILYFGNETRRFSYAKDAAFFVEYETDEECRLFDTWTNRWIPVELLESLIG